MRRYRGKSLRRKKEQTFSWVNLYYQRSIRCGASAVDGVHSLHLRGGAAGGYVVSNADFGSVREKNEWRGMRSFVGYF